MLCLFFLVMLCIHTTLSKWKTKVTNKKMCSSFFLFWMFYTNVFLLLIAILRVNDSITMCVDSAAGVQWDEGSTVIFIRIENAVFPLKNYVRTEHEKWKKWSESKPFAEIGHDLKNVFQNMKQLWTDWSVEHWPVPENGWPKLIVLKFELHSSGSLRLCIFSLVRLDLGIRIEPQLLYHPPPPAALFFYLNLC